MPGPPQGRGGSGRRVAPGSAQDLPRRADPVPAARPGARARRRVAPRYWPHEPRAGAGRRRRGPQRPADEPGQGALPGDRHHQGRGARLLRPGGRGAAAAPAAAPRHPQALARRRGRRRAARDGVLRQGPGRRHPRLGAPLHDPAPGPRQRLPRRRRPGHADLAGPARRPGDPRAAVALRRGRHAAEPRPAGAGPRPRRGRDAWPTAPRWPARRGRCCRASATTRSR